MTMYLTRVLVTKNDFLRVRASDRYSWHQAIWKAFPGILPRTSDLFQWRIDHKDIAIVLWILSSKQPETLDWGRWETKEITMSFLNHRRYVFSLCANPTVMKTAVCADGTIKKNGRRVAIIRENELKQWIRRKGNDAGFELEQVRISPPVKEPFTKGKGRKKTLGVHSRVDFTGILNVVDLEKFMIAYQTGIGSAKGFGFGLLLLKPIE